MGPVMRPPGLSASVAVPSVTVSSRVLGGWQPENLQLALGRAVAGVHQVDDLVGELQALDVPDDVDAVRADRIDDDPAAFRVGLADLIVGARAREDSGVQVVDAAIVEDLAHDLQLGRIDGACEHQRAQLMARERRAHNRAGDQSHHAVGGADLVAGRIEDADAHVEQGIAVDDVVAAAALDDVAAATAKDDVAAVERGDARRRARPAGRRCGRCPRRSSTLPRFPAAWISAASASSPSRMSLKLEPDRPSSWPKRSMTAAFGGRNRRLVEGLSVRSTVTPSVSSL